MQSRLTQRVFRAILENRPYGHSRCSRQLPAVSCTGTNNGGYPQPHQRRCLFSFPSAFITGGAGSEGNPSRAMGNMVTFVRAKRQRVRIPDANVLAAAYVQFIRVRLEQPDLITKSHAVHLLKTFKHLIQETQYAESTLRTHMRAFASAANQEATLAVLAQCPWAQDAQPVVEELATRAYDRLCCIAEFGDPQFELQCRSALVSYVKVLSFCGQIQRALDTIKAHWDPFFQPAGVQPWVYVLQGLAMNGWNGDIPMVLAEMQGLGFTFDPAVHQNIIVTLAEQDYMEPVKMIYESDVLGGSRPTPVATAAAAEAAFRNSMLDWGTEIMAPLQGSPSPETLDATLILALVGGEDPEGVDRMLEGMVASNIEIQSGLSIDTINKLMRSANMVKRYDAVEKFMELASKWGLQPDSNTYSLLIESRQQAGDIPGAIDLFRKSGPDLDASLLNKLVAVLCNADQNKIDFDSITILVDRLVEMGGRFDIETLAALCRALLYRHELESVSDFLRPRIESYDRDQLRLILTTFVDYICDTSEPTDNVWEAYELFNVAFPAAPRSPRLKIMNHFFKLGRTDLACLVFGHMRQKAAKMLRPRPETYARCFYMIGHSADAQNLHLVHNMLKLDTGVEQSTMVLNALMYAYAGCGMPDEAMDFFRQILRSDEGPAKKTLVIFFRVCESHIDGVQEATKMMEKLKALEVEVDSEIYNAYVCALGAHCAIEPAAEAISAMEARIGSPPTSLTIAAFYNSIPFQHWRDEAEQWAKGAYPELWKELEDNIGWKTDGDSRLFDIDRSMNF